MVIAGNDIKIMFPQPELGAFFTLQLNQIGAAAVGTLIVRGYDAQGAQFGYGPFGLQLVINHGLIVVALDPHALGDRLTRFPTVAFKVIGDAENGIGRIAP